MMPSWIQERIPVRKLYRIDSRSLPVNSIGIITSICDRSWIEEEVLKEHSSDKCWPIKVSPEPYPYESAYSCACAWKPIDPSDLQEKYDKENRIFRIKAKVPISLVKHALESELEELRIKK